MSLVRTLHVGKSRDCRDCGDGGAGPGRLALGGPHDLHPPRRRWENPYPVARLAEWLAFYGRMHAQTHHPTYAEDLKLLRALEAELARPPAAGPQVAPVAAPTAPEPMDPLDAAIAEARAAGVDI